MGNGKQSLSRSDHQICCLKKRGTETINQKIRDNIIKEG
jgi:hypothetical protein